MSEIEDTRDSKAITAAMVGSHHRERRVELALAAVLFLLIAGAGWWWLTSATKPEPPPARQETRRERRQMPGLRRSVLPHDSEMAERARERIAEQQSPPETNPATP